MNYRSIFQVCVLSLAILGLLTANHATAEESGGDPEAARLIELNTYWSEVSRTVREGDFEGYRATCHSEAVLVSGKSRNSYPLSKALQRWQVEFDATKAGTMKAHVAFRFSQRFGDATTAHETGIFRYSATNEKGETKTEFIHLQALLVKKSEAWKILMEFQIGPATEAEWNALKPTAG